MSHLLHSFHIPVMGTGFSADTPIRVAHLGISSVVSIVDDLLLERIREHYTKKQNLPYTPIPRNAEDGRARRITAYLNLVHEMVQRKMEEVRNLPFGQDNEKARYFELLPDWNPLKIKYQRLIKGVSLAERPVLEKELTDAMVPGEIDVNIMTKLDRIQVGKAGVPLSEEYSDAKAALRGYVNSTLSSCVEFSAGLNQSLFNYMAKFGDFYRNEMGEMKKRIALKVSDFRSAFVQAKILAKKGLEVHEFRIESGLNCGGHAFASNGYLLPVLLREFREKREQIAEECRPLIAQFYQSIGREVPAALETAAPSICVQGGIGLHGEDLRLRTEYGMDRTGWATPFLLVPEVTCVDDETRELLKEVSEEDCYTSNASPLGVPFNTVRRTGSLRWTAERATTNKPGSPCPKGFLVSNKEFSNKLICTASTEYLKKKLSALKNDPNAPADAQSRAIEKTCLCEHLGNSALIALGMEEASDAPQAICPGPNIAWFSRNYSLTEMIDHIYGRRPSLVPAERPHMFAKELTMYVDHFEQRVERSELAAREVKELEEFAANLEQGIDYCLEIASQKAYPGENLASIPGIARRQRARLQKCLDDLRARVEAANQVLEHSLAVQSA